MKEMIKRIKETECTLPTRFVRELRGDENSLINTYRQMDPEYKSILFTLVTQLFDKQIKDDNDNSDISDDFLYYYVSDVKRFFKTCDFLKPYNFCELVIMLNRNLESITIYGFHYGDISEYAFVTDEMEMLTIMEYVYENINTPANFEEQLSARWLFVETSFYEYKMSLMA